MCLRRACRRNDRRVAALLDTAVACGHVDSLVAGGQLPTGPSHGLQSSSPWPTLEPPLCGRWGRGAACARPPAPSRDGVGTPLPSFAASVAAESVMGAVGSRQLPRASVRVRGSVYRFAHPSDPLALHGVLVGALASPPGSTPGAYDRDHATPVNRTQNAPEGPNAGPSRRRGGHQRPHFSITIADHAPREYPLRIVAGLRPCARD